MVKKRDQTLRKNTFERDNFICRKCGFEDKTRNKLEAHHVIPPYAEGEDNIHNTITLSFDCHHFAPDKKNEFSAHAFLNNS